MSYKDGKATRRTIPADTTGHKDIDRQFVDLIRNPSAFARSVLGHDLWSKQAEILSAVAEYPRVAVKACHGSSKTFAAAEAALYWVTSHSDGIVITTAPTFEQVKNVLWREIHKAIRDSKLAYPKPNQTELRLSPSSYILGWATNEGIRFQGLHGHVLFIVDEAPGVEADIWESIEGARAGGKVHVLALGNPTITGGPFYDAFTEQRTTWKTISIDAFDTPNLEGFTLEMLRDLPAGMPADDFIFRFNPRPYLVSRRWVYEKFWEWGEQSPLWQARVRGQFPVQSEDALISLAWLESAQTAALDTGERVIAGIDVAGPGKDETVVTVRCGEAVLEQGFWSDADPRGHVAHLLNKWRPRLEAVNVDSIGIGYNFGLHLLDLGFPVKLLNVSESSRNSERFLNLKAEWFWALRERFQGGQVKGLVDERTLSQLAQIRYKPNARGQIVIESKEELLRRGVKSPDRADSLMLAFAVRHDPVEIVRESLLLCLDQHLDREVFGTARPSRDERNNPAEKAYEDSRSKMQDQINKMLERKRSRTGLSPQDGFQKCPKCGIYPGPMEPAMYDNKVPTWHEKCRLPTARR
jgi:phage terminase large subunit